MPTPHAALPIRRLTLADLTVCADLAEERGWAREEHKWGLLLAAGTGHGIDAPDGKGLAAMCVTTSYGPALSTFGMMVVAGRFGRQGLGRRLLTHAMHEAGDTPFALYATAQGRPLYEQLGFTAVGDTHTVRGHFNPPDHDRPAPANGNTTVRPATADDLPGLVRLDNEVFGIDRTHLLARLPSFTDRLLITETGTTITGYAGIWPSTTCDVIAPLIAHDTDTAHTLIHALATGTDRPVRLDIDARHTDLLDRLKHSGVELVSTTSTMTRGIPDLPGDPTRRYAPLNLAMG
ncbi:GNAT family N-acetyltransferase [Streptomyces liangshanensis]|uniref:GNAT family N-acetyltransferase n=1 Tax=Streptomyces liangshanensis TaxID=2717324 RepID=A0A6G9H0V5_9ACTN|nr:GNAT family N-acetyltransferase [Streptomyces liangshanensis]QIQ03841.1 GNAT family N-acetyltransferase [Streptomyces liangshanensis]